MKMRDQSFFSCSGDQTSRRKIKSLFYLKISGCTIQKKRKKNFKRELVNTKITHIKHSLTYQLLHTHTKQKKLKHINKRTQVVSHTKHHLYPSAKVHQPISINFSSHNRSPTNSNSARPYSINTISLPLPFLLNQNPAANI